MSLKLARALCRVVCAATLPSVALVAEELTSDKNFSPVQKLMLIDASTNTAVRELKPSDKVNLREFKKSGFNIEAILSENSANKVIFSVNKTKRFREELSAPYALAGDRGGNFKSWRVRPGMYRIGVTPFSSGRKLETHELSLEIVDEDPSSDIRASLSGELASGDDVPEPTEVAQKSEANSAEVKPLEGTPVGGTEPAKEKELKIAFESARISELPSGQQIPETPEIEKKLPATSELENSQQPTSRIEESKNPSTVLGNSISGETASQQAAKVIVNEGGSANVPVGKTFSFGLSDTQVSPPTRSAAFGTCSALIDEENEEAIFGCTHSVMQVKSAYASFVRESDSSEITWCGFESAETPIAAECPLSSEVREALAAGRLFVTITSDKHPAGEIRGIVRDTDLG